MKTPGIILDSEFFTKPRNLLFWSKHGGDGLCIVMAVWCRLARESSHFFAPDMMQVELFSLPRSISQEKFESVIEAAVEAGLLDFDKKSGYYNSKNLSDSKRYEEKIENYKKGRSKRNENSGRIQGEFSESSARTPVNVDVDVNVDVSKEAQEGGGGGSEAQTRKSDPHEGKTKYLNSVYLRQGEHEKLAERYAKEKLSREWVDRGIELLDAYYANKSTKRGCATKRDEYTDDYRVLISWPLQRCVQEAAAKVNLSRQRSYANAPPTYKSNSHPQEVSSGVRGGEMRPIGQIIGKLVGSK